MLKSLLLFTIKSFIATAILFTFISLFVYNLDIQESHWKGNKQIITNQYSIVQALEPLELLDSYFNEK